MTTINNGTRYQMQVAQHVYSNEPVSTEQIASLASGFSRESSGESVSPDALQQIAQLQQIHQMQQLYQAYHALPAGPPHGIEGLNPEAASHLEKFTEYSVSGKDENGEKVEIKVTKEMLENSAPHAPGQLPGLTAALQEKGMSGLSGLSDIEIKGKVKNDDGKEIKVTTSVEDLNKIGSGEKNFGDFEKKGFWGRIGGFFKDVGNGIKKVGEGIGKIGKGAVNFVKDSVTAPFSFAKTLFTTGSLKEAAQTWTGKISSNWQNLADSFTVGWKDMTDGYGLMGSASARMLYGDTVGDLVQKGLSGITHWVGETFVGGTLGSAAQATRGMNQVAHGDALGGLTNMAVGSLDLALTVGSGGTATAAKGVAKGITKTAIKEIAGETVQRGAKEVLEQGAKKIVKESTHTVSENALKTSRKSADDWFNQAEQVYGHGSDAYGVYSAYVQPAQQQPPTQPQAPAQTAPQPDQFYF